MIDLLSTYTSLSITPVFPRVVWPLKNAQLLFNDAAIPKNYTDGPAAHSQSW